METVREFIYHDVRVSAGGGCEAVVTARTRLVCIVFKDCDELILGRFL